MRSQTTPNIILALICCSSIAFACFDIVDDTSQGQCCFGQFPNGFNGCVEKTCEGGNRYNKRCDDIGITDAGWSTCETVAVQVKKTVLAWPRSGSICLRGAGVVATQLPDEFASCNDAVVDTGCDGS